MATTGTHKLNVTILDGANQITHWTGSPATDGGELTFINMSSPVGPNIFDFDSTGVDRAPYTFSLDTKISGATLAAQTTFINKYKPGTSFPSTNITGLGQLAPNTTFAVRQAKVTHNDGDTPSMLNIILHEVAPIATGP